MSSGDGQPVGAGDQGPVGVADALRVRRRARGEVDPADLVAVGRRRRQGRRIAVGEVGEDVEHRRRILEIGDQFGRPCRRSRTRPTRRGRGRTRPRWPRSRSRPPCAGRGAGSGSGWPRGGRGRSWRGSISNRLGTCQVTRVPCPTPSACEARRRSLGTVAELTAGQRAVVLVDQQQGVRRRHGAPAKQLPEGRRVSERSGHVDLPSAVTDGWRIYGLAPQRHLPVAVTPGRTSASPR